MTFGNWTGGIGELEAMGFSPLKPIASSSPIPPVQLPFNILEHDDHHSSGTSKWSPSSENVGRHQVLSWLPPQLREVDSHVLELEDFGYSIQLQLYLEQF